MKNLFSPENYNFDENDDRYIKKLKYLPTKRMLKESVDNIIRPACLSEMNWICPCGDVIIENLQMENSDWKLKPAKQICCTDNGFSSGCVSIGDCVWTQDQRRGDVILEITHV